MELEQIIFVAGAYGAARNAGSNHSSNLSLDNVERMVLDVSLRMVRVTEKGRTSEYLVPVEALMKLVPKAREAADVPARQAVGGRR